MNPFFTLTNNRQNCPKCGRGMSLKLAGPDSKHIPGRYYFSCFNTSAHTERFWHVFPPGALPDREIQVELRSPSASPSPMMPYINFPPAGAPPSSMVYPRCAKLPCQKIKVHRSCSRHMCKPHCISEGGCKAHEVDKSMLSTNKPLISLNTRIYPPESVPEFNVLQATPNIIRDQQSIPDYNSWDDDRISTQSAPIPSSSQISSSSHTARPRMTTQMNPTWMNAYKSASPLPVRKATLSHRFYLIIFNDAITPGDVKLITNYGDWPTFTVPSFKELGLSGGESKGLQLYIPKLHLWTDIDVGSTHLLTDECAIMIRLKGVLGASQDRLIEQFFPKSSLLSPPRRFRSNFADERKQIQRLQKSRLPQVEESDSDEVEFVSPVKSKGKRKYTEISPSSGGTSRKRRQASPEIIEDDQHLLDPWSYFSPTPSSQDQPIPSLLSVLSTATTSMDQAALNYPPSPLPSNPGSTRVFSPIASTWPAHEKASDVVNGFLKIDENLGGRRIPKDEMKTLLEHVYGTRIKYNTYRDQRTKWTRAPPDLRERVLEMELPWNYLASRVKLR